MPEPDHKVLEFKDLYATYGEISLHIKQKNQELKLLQDLLLRTEQQIIERCKRNEAEVGKK